MQKHCLLCTVYAFNYLKVVLILQGPGRRSIVSKNSTIIKIIWPVVYACHVDTGDNGFTLFLKHLQLSVAGICSCSKISVLQKFSKNAEKIMKKTSEKYHSVQKLHFSTSVSSELFLDFRCKKINCLKS